jgi:hypothetical protein
MTRAEMILGQTVYLADIIERDLIEKHDRILVREYKVKLLGKRFYELLGPKHRIKQTWDGNMGTIRLLALSPAQAVKNRELLLDARLAHARESLRRHEADVEEKRKAFIDWYNQRGL